MEIDRQTTFLTREGLQKLKQDLDYLRTVKRQEVAQRLHLALAEGDTVLENAELEDARNEQAFVEGKILTMEHMLRNAVIIDEGPHETVELGSHVTVTEGDGPPETYQIVGSAEAAPANGLISNESPLGRALIGRKVGETAEVYAPDGVLVFKIVGIG